MEVQDEIGDQSLMHALIRLIHPCYRTKISRTVYPSTSIHFQTLTVGLSIPVGRADPVKKVENGDGRSQKCHDMRNVIGKIEKCK